MKIKGFGTNSTTSASSTITLNTTAYHHHHQQLNIWLNQVPWVFLEV
jgi:hypothetical protein